MTSPTAVQRRAGTAAEHASFIGLPAELTVDETNHRVVVHDGLTSGGHPMAKASEISGFASLASPTFTGVPAAPTAAPGTNTTQLATTAFVKGEVDAVIAAAPGQLNTLDELAAALGDDANFASTVTSSLATKAPLASPALTGNPTTPTQATSDTSTKIASTAFVKAAIADAGGSDVEDLAANQDFMSVVLADLYGNYLGMSRGWTDAFDTEDGIDTTSSTNESYNAAGDYYTPTATSPSNQIVAHVGSNTSASGTISASAEDAPAYNAANGSDSEANYWITASGSGWLKYAFTAAKTIATYEVTACVTSFSRYPTDWTLEASATGSFSGEQVVLDTRTAQSFSVAQVKSYTIASPASYQYYRLNISASSNGANLTVIEWRLYDAGTPNNMTLISKEFAAPANVGVTAAFLDLEFSSALTGGTDFDFAMTSAGTPSYTSTGASYTLWYSSGNTKRYLVKGINLSVQADDAVRARFRTLTNKAIKITGWRPRWEDA